MYQMILLLHVFVAICVIALVLVQQGKGATMGAAFGSGASQTVFGSRGSGSFLFRITMSLIVIFFITSISLNYLASRAYKDAKVISLPISTSKQAPVTNPAANIPMNNSTAPATSPSSTELPDGGLKIDLPIKKS